MKRFLSILCSLVLLAMTGCSGNAKSEYTKYSSQFYGTFDTVVQVVGYCKTEDEFKAYASEIKDRFTQLNKLYDIYYSYAGVNNIKTINENAGIAPVKVEPEVLDLIDFCLEWYDKTEGQVNIALGPVLSIWHGYMEQYSSDSTDAKLPPIENLEAARQHTDISKVIVDRDAGTVYLAEKDMALDVGAVAKGFATQLICDEMVQKGFTSFCISAGGNVVTEDAPLDEVRDSWGIGIQNPFTADDPTASNGSLDVAYVSHQCVVTSGDYQRYYMVGDQRIHHIIDPATLMPANYYRAVTIVTEDSAIADLASTTLFTLPYEESRALAEKMGWKVMWVFADQPVQCTENLVPLLRDRGGATGLLK